MHPYTPKVGQHVGYLRSDGKLRSATVTGVTSSTVVNLRVGHGGETYTAVNKQSADNQSGRWRTANAYDDVPTFPSFTALLLEDGSTMLVTESSEPIASEA